MQTWEGLLSTFMTAVVDTAIPTASVALVAGTGLLWKISRGFRQMADDWRGEPARPGVPERPGVMVRLQAIETSQSDMSTQIEEIRHEVKPNSGTSMRDSIARIHQSTTGRPDPGAERENA